MSGELFEADSSKMPAESRAGAGPIKPLCTKHKTAMVSRAGVKDFFCNEAGCARVYNTSSGYFDKIGDEATPQEEGIAFCLDLDGCGSSMYLESVHQNGSEKWRCPQVNCGATVRR